MKIELANRLALVAEGGNEIGRAICRQLLASGARVVCLVRTADAAEASRAWFREAGAEVTVLETDITDFQACEQTVREIEKDNGGIDIVINNTDIDCYGEFNRMTESQWAQCREVNLDSAFNLCRLTSENMSERGYGRIVNVSSVYSRNGEPGMSAYAAAKSGLHGFTLALAQEVARKGVTVNTVSPGHINVNGAREIPVDDPESVVAGIPASRLGEAEEVASLVDFLCSEQAGFITGSDIPINGGQYLH